VSVAGVGLGIALMVEGRLGVSPNDVTSTGLADVLDVSVGVGAWIVAAVATAAAWALGRRPSVATLLSSIGVGLGIDVALAVVPEGEGPAARIALLLCGLGVIWAAITGIVSSAIGLGPIELLMLALTDRGIRLHVARWGIEVTLVAIGAVLGGSLGVGTVAFALGTGPVLAWSLPLATRLMGTDLTRPPAAAAAGP